MSNFSLRTAAVGITLSTISALGLVNGNLTSIANRCVGQAEITTYKGDLSSLDAGVERFAGWKIFDYKIWDGAGKVVVAALSAAASYLAVDAINGPGDTTRMAHLSDLQNSIQQSILIEELN
ncbi:hypothetical protein [Dyadobacter psychrotolerans]|uniref:Uncharacterized protein n=1 Tax=Dyadobacter psychrotolerans TaxID=2541721 RepID=A0A4R5DMK7_9BACT|nr:hypothetical protein [Dyadobacter psychrotolerans]TDE12135.1 hypothetical protein E0F88_24125 [Dyadobacter psychrotolerans]